jgi:hypothetical protein
MTVATDDTNEQQSFPGEDEAVHRMRAWYRRTYPLIRTKHGMLTDIVDTGDFRVRLETSGSDAPRLSIFEELNRCVQDSAARLGERSAR